jgi:uncharacterized membrane protein
MMHEKSYRSFVKGVSYRIIGTITTFIISFCITGKVDAAVTIGIVDVISKVAIYYVHERTWNRISFGRVKQVPTEYEI